jgi:CheY-like chemotaxis protein
MVIDGRDEAVVWNQADKYSAKLKKLNLRILLVEDNTINQDLARIVLESEGQQVVVAGNGWEALDCLLREEFDIILMDIQMPKMDGLVATTIIRSCEQGNINAHLLPGDMEEKLMARLKGKRVPIITMTANVMASDREKCKEVGMDEFLGKPFSPEELHGVLERLEMPVRSEPLQPVRPAEIKSLKEMAVTHLKQVYKLDDKTVKHLLNVTYDKLDSSKSELQAAFLQNDSVKLQALTHSLKGVFFNIGLVELAELAKEIETGAKARQQIEQDLLDRLFKKINNFLREIGMDNG